MTAHNDELYNESVHAFLTLFRYLRSYSQQIHASGQSGRRISALRFLLEHGKSTMGTLSDYLYISVSSTTEIVGKLEEAALVTRVRSKSDNRVVLVDLTEKGRRTAAETEVGGIPLLRERLKALPSDRLTGLRDTFRELCRLLDIPEEQ
jgi:MarR family transcriptional regulator, organic hydroperoxide resistance regulator